MYKRIAAVTAVALLALASPAEATKHGNEQQTIGDAATGQRPPCGEYTRGRVLIGEFQTPTCNVQPPQKLDMLLFPKRLDGKTPRERCDHSGGHFHKHRDGTLRCNGIDF